MGLWTVVLAVSSDGWIRALLGMRPFRPFVVRWAFYAPKGNGAQQLEATGFYYT